MSINYVNTGATRQIGRFGLVAAGAIISLTDAEAASLAADSVLKPLPVPSRMAKRISSHATLSAGDSGKQIRCTHTAHMTLTLPENPTAGLNYEVCFADNASAHEVTLTPASGDKLNDVEDATHVLTSSAHMVNIYFNGTSWVTV